MNTQTTNNKQQTTIKLLLVAIISSMSLVGTVAAQHTMPEIRTLDLDLRFHFQQLSPPTSPTQYFLPLDVKLCSPSMYNNNNQDTIDFLNWWSLYEDMYYAAYDTSTKVPLDTVADKVIAVYDTILLGLMDLNYDDLIYDSILYDTNFFYIDTVTNSISDNANRSSSPYKKGELFAVAPLNEIETFTNVVYKLDPEYVFVDNPQDYTSGTFQIDFGDGLGPQLVSSITTETIYPVQYSGAGKKHIYAEVLDPQDNVTKSSRSTVPIKFGQKKITADQVLNFSDVRVAKYDACSPLKGTNAEKVILHIPGYDITGGRVTAEGSYTKAMAKHNFAQLRNQGYTIYSLEFEEPFADISINTAAVMNVIDWLKGTHCTSGDIQPQFVMITQSFGALYARYALNLYEQNPNYGTHRHDLTHNTRLCLFLDPSFFGYNLPLSMQFGLEVLFTKLAFVNPFLQRRNINTFKILNSMATKQALREHIAGLSLDNFNFSTSQNGNVTEHLLEFEYSSQPLTEHINFFNLVKNSSPTGTGWPEHCKLVALSYGMLNGQNTTRNGTSNLKQPGDIYFAGTYQLSFSLFGKILNAGGKTFALSTPVPNTTSTIFELQNSEKKRRLRWRRWKLPTYDIEETKFIQRYSLTNAIPMGIYAGGQVSGRYYADGILDRLGNRNLLTSNIDPNGTMTFVSMKKIGPYGFTFIGVSNDLGFTITPTYSALAFDAVGAGLDPYSPDILSLPTSQKMAHTPLHVIKGEIPNTPGIIEPEGNKNHFGVWGNYVLPYPQWQLNNGDSVYLLNREIGDDTLYLENINYNRNATHDNFFHLEAGKELNKIYEYPNIPNFSILDVPENYFSDDKPYEVEQGKNTELNCWGCNTISIHPTALANVPSYGNASVSNVYPLSCAIPNVNYRKNKGRKDIPMNIPTISDNLYLYPNPNKGDFTVVLSNKFKIEQTQISLFDINGKCHASISIENLQNIDNHFPISVTNLPPGMYNMVVHDNNYTESLKFNKL